MSHIYWLTRKAAPYQNNYSPYSFGWGGHLDPTSHGSLIVPFSYNGVAFPGGVHRDFRAVLHNLCLDLERHVEGGFVAGQCGCYVNRNVRGSSSRSFHSWGIAADFNWNHNPMGEPSDYGKRHVLPKITAKIATRNGCQWGGTWTGRRDAMHIECHLPPAIARKVKVRHKATRIYL